MDQTKVIAALEDLRERVSDPDRLVLNPHETYDGCRACLLGHAWRLADARGLDRWYLGGLVEMASRRLGYLPTNDMCEAATVALANGATVEVVDEAIRAVRETELVPA